MNLFHFFSSFNTAYNNKFRFFYFREVPKLKIILNLFVKKGLIIGFFFIHKKVVVILKYLNDVPFFKIIAISKPSRHYYFNSKRKIRGRLSGSDCYIVNSPKNGFYFSDSFKEHLVCKDNKKEEEFEHSNCKEGGEVLFKVAFFNENNASKKNIFV